MASVSVVYQSRKGHTKVLAEAVLRGVDSIDGVSGTIFEIRGPDIHEGRFANESLMGELDRSDAVVFGCATYMGSVSAIFKAFLKAAFQLHWLEQRSKVKIAAGFTNSASRRQVSTLMQLTVFTMQMGMIWVGVEELPGNNWSGGSRTDLNRLGTWLGAMDQSNADEDSPKHRRHIDTAERLGSRGALIARRFKDGTAFETTRFKEPEFRLLQARREVS